MIGIGATTKPHSILYLTTNTHMGKITTAFIETVSTHHLKTSETRPQNCTNITQNPTRMKSWFCEKYHLSSGMRRCQKCKISQNQRIENDWIWRSKLFLGENIVYFSQRFKELKCLSSSTGWQSLGIFVSKVSIENRKNWECRPVSLLIEGFL